MSRGAGRFLELGHFSPPGAPARAVRLYVPPGVDAERPHPTLWLFDGQNVFGDEGSFAGGWHAHQTMDDLGDKRHRRPVVVAIENGGAHRIRELGPHVGDFVSAVVEDLVPRVEGVVHGRGPRIVGGASLGGLGALHAWLAHPEVFSGALVMSPSLWFEQRRLLRAIERGDLALPAHGRIYVDAGGRERGRMFADAEHLARVLKEAGLGEDRLLWRPDARGTHQERHWRRRLPKAARFLFKR
jgi:predicted alpha/beta superfamily hydrolase